MNIFEKLSLPINNKSHTGANASYGVSLPNLFGNNLLDMPTSFGFADEFVLGEVGDSSQPVVYEEVIDFFVDSNDPSKVLISRSGVPSSSPPTSSASSLASTLSLVPTRPSIVPIPKMSLSASRHVSEASVHKRPKTSIAAGEEERIAIRRERNRQAAERCRARRVDLITSLQAECEQLRAEKERLVRENRALMEALARSGSSLSSCLQ